MKAKFKESAVKQLKIQDVTYEYYNLESLSRNTVMI